MAARNGGKLASELAGIECPNAALDFDLACTIRLNAYDLEVDQTRAKLIAYEVSKIFGSGEGGEVAADAGAEVW